MLATALPAAAPLPRGPAWLHEVKWDGVRLVVDAAGGRLRATTRTGRDVTALLPELHPLAELGDVLLDGEVVVLDAGGRPSFGAVAGRLAAAAPPPTPREGSRLAYVAFDLLRASGRDLAPARLRERREALERLDLERCGAPVSLSALHADGEALWAATASAHLEGVVSKRRDSPYAPGLRSPDWVKRAHRARRTVLVGGWRGEVGRPRSLGALLVGAPDATTGALRYLGRVGSGLAGARAAELAALLAPLTAGSPPFATRVPPPDAAGATWCAPLVAVEVAHLGVTDGGRLRQPSVLGVRLDAPPDPAPDAAA